MTNPKFAAIVEAARQRTAKMLAESESARNLVDGNKLVSAIYTTDRLPSSLQIQTKEPKPFEGNKEITINGKTFNPYFIEGVGELNVEQSRAVDWFGLQGKSGCLIGPAGTGKTTTMKAIIRAIILSGRVPIIPDEETHKYLHSGLPGIYGGSFTRIATRNLRDNTPSEIQSNIHTIHRLLEFEPEFKEVLDKETGKIRTIRYFIPTRNIHRKLPRALMVVEIDESSMVGLDLHTKLMAALHPGTQIIYIGDIAQLPPVMDTAILGYKLLELPVVELTHVYRHSGVIVNLANHIRIGNTIPANRDVVPYSTNLRRMPRKLVEDAIEAWNKEEDGSKVTIHLWKNRLEGEVGQLRAIQNIANFFYRELTSGDYNIEKHMILMPYNKAVGTIEVNKFLADHLGKKRNAEVHEVISGREKQYLAVGDKVFFEREESLITEINKNGLYSGRLPQPSSVTLDRWGHNGAGKAQITDAAEFDSIDNLLNVNVEDEERKNQASHIIHVKKLRDIQDEGDDADEYECSTTSEVNSLIFGYALTIHKAQGSQWEKVYCIFHNSHNRNLQRELLYTAITRAQKELYVICEPETFVQGVLSQHIVGNTLAEKAEYFKGKKEENDKRDQLFNRENGDTQ